VEHKKGTVGAVTLVLCYHFLFLIHMINAYRKYSYKSKRGCNYLIFCFKLNLGNVYYVFFYTVIAKCTFHLRVKVDNTMVRTSVSPLSSQLALPTKFLERNRKSRTLIEPSKREYGPYQRCSIIMTSISVTEINVHSILVSFDHIRSCVLVILLLIILFYIIITNNNIINNIVNNIITNNIITNNIITNNIIIITNNIINI